MTNTSNAKVDPKDLPLARFAHWEATQANKVFMTQPMGGGQVQQITWAQAGQDARKMAAWLQAQDWPAGSRVAIWGKNSAHWMLADLAIWMAGFVSVPVYPTFNAATLRYILEHSEAKACFIGKLDDTEAYANGFPSGVAKIALPLSPPLQLSTWDDITRNAQPLASLPERGADELATIIYTSGTTGMPKGVMQTFGALGWSLSTASKRIHMDSNDRYLSYLPLAHVAERMVIEQGVLRNGSEVFFAESLDTFVADMQRARPTIFFSVPRLWVKFQQGVHHKMPPAKLRRLLAIPILGRIVAKKVLTGLGLDQCRLAAGGAAPMPADLLKWYRTLGLDLIEVYGMTENCGVSHSTLPGTFKPGTVGLPYDGVDCRIDPQTGEIQMRGECLMQGYYKEEAMTAATMTQDGWLRTGDKGHIEVDGSLRITGRVKDIFKTSKGKYVAPAPIEDLLVTHPDVEACAVTGANLPQPLALAMLSQEAVQRIADPAQKQALELSLKELLGAINQQLQPHEKLDCIVVVTTNWTPENGMVTPTFKVKRNNVEGMYAAQYENWTALGKAVVWA
jgi:long-chain acyl-CoA synthetase